MNVRIERIRNELRELKKADPRVDTTEILEKYLNNASDDEERYNLLVWLALEHRLQERYIDFERVIKEAISVCQNSPIPWYYLAEHYLYYDVNLESAEKNIEIAVEKALHRKKFVRPVMGVRIRVALERSDYEAVQNALEILIEYVPIPESPEIEPETDFLKKIPKGKVKKSIIDRYIRKFGVH